MADIRMFERLIAVNGVDVLTGASTLTLSSKQFIGIDPGGDVDLDLPAVSAGTQGLWFWIKNNADAAETVTIKDADGNTVQALAQNQWTVVICENSAWISMGALVWA